MTHVNDIGQHTLSTIGSKYFNLKYLYRAINIVKALPKDYRVTLKRFSKIWIKSCLNAHRAVEKVLKESGSVSETQTC